MNEPPGHTADRCGDPTHAEMGSVEHLKTHMREGCTNTADIDEYVREALMWSDGPASQLAVISYQLQQHEAGLLTVWQAIRVIKDIVDAYEKADGAAP